MKLISEFLAFSLIELPPLILTSLKGNWICKFFLNNARP